MTNPTTTQRLKERFPDLTFRPLVPPTQHPFYAPRKLEFIPNKHEFLPKGHLKEEGRRKIQVDTVLERNVAIVMRDGIKIYVDIFRPANSTDARVPAIIAWSPYGKGGSEAWDLKSIPHRMGVPLNRTSGYEAWEAPDPADWCRRGYAVVNADARGSQFSEGTLFLWGDQEAEDIYDTVEWLSKQPWCNGSVCMMGNSYLARAQITYGSRMSHPAMKALAPWEGFTDTYRQLFFRGGMSKNKAFRKLYAESFAGNLEIEDMEAMAQNHELYDAYWEGKYDHIEQIDVPLYILGSYSNPFHVYGSFDTFRRARTQHKWLRVHSTFEWYDLYRPESNHDLQRFFDRFCKGIQNGWEHDTPRLRLSLLGFDGSVPTIVERPEKEFPLARQQLTTYFLHGTDKSMKVLRSNTVCSVSHAGHSLDASSDFILRFTGYTEVAGYAKVRLWMSCDEKDDMDIVVQVRKVDKDGKVMTHMNFPAPDVESDLEDVCLYKYFGPQGFRRASHSVSRDESMSSRDGQEVFYRHDCQEKIPPGKIVPVEITLWPMGMVFGAGEGVMLRIAGHDMGGSLFPGLPVAGPDDENVGNHTVYTGGEYDSCLILPIVAGSGL
ncbi:alpha/beta-hydrolase [Aspergillus similis]